MKLNRNFYNRNTIDVAKDLLGKVLIHKNKEKITSGRIVEDEAYLGFKDKAAHSYGGKKTERVKIMYGKPGLAYVYIIYGMYYCFNVVTRKEGIPEAVLVRALEPLEGLDIMSQRRFDNKYNNLNKNQKLGLTNGPGKLCIAMGIDKNNNGYDLCQNRLYIEDDNMRKFNIVDSKRIGINYAEEARDYLLRFYIEGNYYVSKK